jgi:predicted dehydrogenase
VAILGCRGRGEAAGQAYRAHPRTEVVALCDLLPERLESLGEKLGVGVRFADLDEMIQQTRPDIVAIPTGTEFHHDLALRVLAHGVHIDIEKPLCTDLEKADEVVARAREEGVRIAVHHQGRLGAYLQAAHRAFQEGRIGKLLYMYTRDKGYYGGLGIMNIATHKVNMMLKFAGHCRSVSAVALTDGHLITPEDVVTSPLGMGTIAGEHITATLHFDDNVTAGLLQHRLPRISIDVSVIEFLGTEGRLLFTNKAAWWLPHPHYFPDGEHDAWEPLEPICPEHYDPESAAGADEYCYVDEYVQALDKGREHECSGPEGLHVLEVLMGIFESGAYGRRVELPQTDRRHPLRRWRREHGLADPDPVPRDHVQWLEEEDQRLGRVQAQEVASP